MTLTRYPYIGICRAGDRHWFPAGSTAEKCPDPECDCTPSFYMPVSEREAAEARIHELEQTLDRATKEVREQHGDRAIAPGMECGCEFCAHLPEKGKRCPECGESDHRGRVLNDDATAKVYCIDPFHVKTERVP